MYSDRPPAFVFPETPDGYDRMKAFIAEEPDALWGAVKTCDRYSPQAHPVYTDDDIYSLRPRHVRPCANRSREGVRDMNWCCRCEVGLPHHVLTKRDSDRLSDHYSLSGF